MVIFHRIAGLDDLDPLQPGDRADHLELHILGQRGGDPVRIDGRVVKAFGLKENLMPVAIGEAMDLVLDRGAITRAHAGNLACEERRAVEIGADDLMRARVRAGDRAEELRCDTPRAHRRHRPFAIVGRLALKPRPVDRPAVKARRRARLQPGEGQPQGAELAAPFPWPPVLPPGRRQCCSCRNEACRPERCPSQARPPRRRVPARRRASGPRHAPSPITSEAASPSITVRPC